MTRRTPSSAPRVVPHAVPDVNTLPCPEHAAGGTHELRTYSDGTTGCRWCLVSWADLDAALRPEGKTA